jgi:glycosyltransferase involved in cell wall biosynthesis
MKILFITHYSFLYGANKSLLQLLIDLRIYYNVKATVIIPEKGTFSDKLEENNIDYYVFNYYNWLNVNTFIIAKIKIIINKFLFKRVLNSLKNYNYNFIHTNSSVTNLGGYLSNKMKIPHIWHIREYGQDDFNLKYGIGIKRAGNYFNSNASVIITVSNDLKAYYSKYINPEKMKVIHNGIKIKNDFKKVYNFTEPLRICVMGAISENKNQIEVIKALAYLKNKKKQSNFILYIVGDGLDKYIRVLKLYIEKEGLCKNVVFKGYIENVDAFLETIDLGVVSSKREAFGRVTVEYMMHKIPVIASRKGANKEIIKTDDLGYLYDCGNVEQLAKIIKNINSNRADLQLMGDRVFDYSINNFSSKLNAHNIYNVYEQLVIV